MWCNYFFIISCLFIFTFNGKYLHCVIRTNCCKLLCTEWTLLSSNNLYLWREINIPNRDCVICSDFLNKKQSVIRAIRLVRLVSPHSQSSKVISLFGASGSEEETLGENFSMVPLQYYALSPWYYWIICIFNKCIPDKTCWKRNFLKRFQVFRQNLYFWWKSLGPA